MDGVLRGKYVSLEKFGSCLNSNLSFCGVIHGWDLHGRSFIPNNLYFKYHATKNQIKHKQ